MGGVELIMSCLLGALSCDMEALNPPEGMDAPQIVTICPRELPKDGQIMYSHSLPSKLDPKILVILSCGKPS